MPARVVVPLAAAAACLSCQALFGVDEDDPSSSADTLGSAGRSGDEGSGAGPASSGVGAGTGECAICGSDVPAGWLGPSYLYTTKATEGFSCPNLAVSSTFFEGEPEAAFECGMCTCGAPTEVACTVPLLTCYADHCGGQVSYAGTPDPCVFLAQFAACAVGVSSISAGKCAPAGGATSLATWQLGHHLCPAAPLDETCDEGVCLGGPGDPAPREVCVLSESEGHVQCPAGFDHAIQAWSDATDTRSCNCGCGPAEGTCTGGGYEVTTVPFGCDLATTAGPGTCVTGLSGGNTYANYKDMNGVIGGCVASGPSPSGTFTPAGARTICCRSWP